MKILFLVDYMLPKATTNAICVKNIAKKMVNDGNNVFICSYGNKKFDGLNEEEMNIFFVRPSLSRIFLNKSLECKNLILSKVYNYIGKFLNRLSRIIFFPLYPIVSYNFSRRWSNKITKLVKKYDIECIISTAAPNDSIYAGYLCKKKNPNLIWIPYYLDSGSNLLPGSSFETIKKYLQKKYQKWENKVFSYADGIIIMVGHESYYRQILSNKIFEKVYISNVPLFTDFVDDSINKFSEPNKHNEIWMYAGSMRGSYYDPHTIIDFFNLYNSKNNNSFLKLFGSTDQQSYIKNCCMNGRIKWYGNVNHDILNNEYLNADILVYYINGSLDSVSGKFFEYIKYGKIIIYVGDSNDINANLVKQYDKGIVVPKIDDSNMNELLLKISKLKIKLIDKDKLLKKFELSTPEYTKNIINKIVKEKRNEINK